MDKSWVDKDSASPEYEIGLNAFLDYAYIHGKLNREGKLKCPCTVCKNFNYQERDKIIDDLICYGMLPSYTIWIHHGERNVTTPTPEIRDEDLDTDTHVAADGIRIRDDLGGLLGDAFLNEVENTEDMQNELGDVNLTFKKLLEQSKKELYPGCDKMTVLSFVIRLWHIKCINQLSNKAFTMMLQLARDSFPDGCSLPKNFTQCKKIITDLGMGYNKIDACRNDCMLFWKEDSKLNKCSVCGASRWKIVRSGKKKNTPWKILRHFSLIPRLQRLFTSKTAKDMRYHEEGRTKDGVLRHPADSMAWKHFDETNPVFASDPRSVRLGLASDGFNPFSNMTLSHSTWPVVLVPYNLPPWLCMKQPHFILSLVIPGPSSPGNNIDVYLRPLIEELKELWAEGVDTYDSFSKETFKLRAAVLWTISDFPGLAMLSGWSTKGKLACPTCQKGTRHRRLKNGRKECYMGHRRWLPLGHRFRNLKKDFDGTLERETAPVPLNGKEVVSLLKDIPHKFGKKPEENDASGKKKGKTPRVKKKRPREEETTPFPDNWKKLSIMYELPYWSENLLKHNCDVMHIEKNVCENILGTLLELGKKCKDGLKARLDLKEMRIRPELHPEFDAVKNKYYLPPACYYLDKDQKELFCTVLSSLKIPDGYSSNIGRHVKVKERKLIGLKSHDLHVILQQFLPLAIRKTLPTKVSSVLIELSLFFRELCSKTLVPEDLRRLEERIAVTLCNLERIFPPTFFDVMVHLLIHLASEALLGGPVHYRWMYPIERYLYTLKTYVRNMAQPEGCIAEGYIADECVTFMVRYLDQVETRLSRPPRYTENSHIGGFESFMLDTAEKKMAHTYILFNHDGVQTYLAQHKRLVSLTNRGLSLIQKQKIHEDDFAQWFKEEMALLKEANLPISEEVYSLSRGPFHRASRFTGYSTNGYVFRTLAKERDLKTQSSGVMIHAIKESAGESVYYGRLTDIIELSYPLGHKFVLFNCDWVDVEKGKGIKEDSLKFTLVNFTHLLSTQRQEPYVLASQVKQVFYVEDPTDPGWHVVLTNKPRDTFDLGGEDDGLVENTSIGQEDGDDEINLVRDDVEGTVVDPPNVDSRGSNETAGKRNMVNQSLENEDEDEDMDGSEDEDEDEDEEQEDEYEDEDMDGNEDEDEDENEDDEIDDSDS